jgi:hypothetical protein
MLLPLLSRAFQNSMWYSTALQAGAFEVCQLSLDRGAPSAEGCCVEGESVSRLGGAAVRAHAAVSRGNDTAITCWCSSYALGTV